MVNIVNKCLLLCIRDREQTLVITKVESVMETYLNTSVWINFF